MVTLEQGSRRPYAYKGRAFRRVGASTVELPRDQYNKMVLEQMHGVTRWESEPSPEWTVDDLNATEIVRTLDEGIRRGRIDDPGTRDAREILRGLGLVRDGVLLRAAVVLFARSSRLLPDFPQCALRVARFRGLDKTEFLDNRQFHGNVFELLQRAERYLRENLPVAGRIVPNLFERQDDPLYPPSALREALANAFVHRDYSIGGGAVTAGIYDDRLEITSSGALHFGITVDDLYRPHASQPWNPLMADVLYKRGIIETWGRGTLKITELTERAGLPRAEFEEIPGAVVVRFRPSRYIAPQRVPHDLIERRQTILSLLGSIPSLALRELAAAMPEPVPNRTLIEDLRFLKQLELVDRSGAGRGARWFLKGRLAN